MKRCSYDKPKYKAMRAAIRILEIFTFGKKIMVLRRWFVSYYFKNEKEF